MKPGNKAGVKELIEIAADLMKDPIFEKMSYEGLNAARRAAVQAAASIMVATEIREHAEIMYDAIPGS